MTEPGDFGARDRQHLSINSFSEGAQYAFPPRQMKRKPLREDYAAHANALLAQLSRALGTIPEHKDDHRFHVEGLKAGAIVELATPPPAAGSRSKAVKIPANLDFPAQQISVLRTARRGDCSESAVLFVPDDAREFLRDRIVAYGNDPGEGARADLERFEVIETIAAASIASLFVRPVDLSDTTMAWWELWLSGDADHAARVTTLARGANLDVHSDQLVFPETTVVFIHATAGNIAEFAERLPGAVSEIRPATGSIEPFLDHSIGGTEPADWVAELAQRVVAPPHDAPVVCALDTGVAGAHPLIKPGLRRAWAYDIAWGTDDHHPGGGHGTAVAGLALYGDLEPHMNTMGPVILSHGVESMKLLPPHGFPATKPPSFGVVTQGAVALVEAEQPGAKRTFCLANSTTDFSPARPSSWSGALDQIAAGSMLGDMAENVRASQSPKRLLLVATGNVSGGMLSNVMSLQTIEDPSQSWNALTIGGFTRKEQVPTPPPAYQPVVPANHRSPYSRGSQALPDDLTPIKPEVLFEAGNMVSDNTGFCGWNPAVSLLAPGSDVTNEPLVPFWATSAAVGVAGNFVGRLQAAHPDLWPETLRALTVDAAAWPQPIRKLLIGRGAHWKTGTKSQKQKILREVGYGVPDIERAIWSARNDMSMIAQAEIQPFAIGGDGRSAVYKEMHFYDLPWPRQALEQLENEIVIMKVTLSYFIEPNLTGKAATRPNTYRSFGMRFAMKKRNETDSAFRARINAAQERDESTNESEADFWLLGSKAIQAGSLHCDLWRGHAIDLAGHDAIAVYPVGGWWKSHLGQHRMEDKARYSLVISISAKGLAVDLHTEVASLVATKEIEIDIG